ncbi:hypothetical protein [Spiroplasma endosymbiont of Amphibalanus improvisus]|uniref:hypothetical protein n=1 Tax=Spiroplasma endosymbiont of Amphibalanus improvisus TaxID=3066327 RepID=UPI00313BF0AB
MKINDQNNNLNYMNNTSRPMMNQNGQVNSRPMMNQNDQVNSRPMMNQNDPVNSRPMMNQNGPVNSRPMMNQNGPVNSRPMMNQNGPVNSRPMMNQNGPVNSRPMMNQNGQVNSRPMMNQNGQVNSRPMMNQNGQVNSRPMMNQNDQVNNRPMMNQNDPVNKESKFNVAFKEFQTKFQTKFKEFQTKFKRKSNEAPSQEINREEKKDTFWTTKNIWIVAATSVLVISIILAIALPLSLRGDKFNIPDNVYDSINVDTVSYYETQDRKVFEKNVENSALVAINAALPASQQLSANDLSFDWNNVNFNTTGQYNVGVEVVNNTHNKYYIPDIKVNITGISVIDLSDVSFSDVFDVNPYVTTDASSYQSVVKNEIDSFFESKGISSDAVQIKFGSSANSDNVDLSQSTQAGGTNLESYVKITANSDQHAVVGVETVNISPEAYNLNDLLDQGRSLDNTVPYETKYNDIYLPDVKSNGSGNDNNYFDLTGRDGANSAKINHDIQENIHLGLTEISDKNGLNIPTGPDGTYTTLLDYAQFPYSGTTDSVHHNDDSTKPWAPEGSEHVWQNHTWTRHWDVLAAQNNGVFVYKATIDVTFFIPDY